MAVRILIVGYGRAGVRHRRLLSRLGKHAVQTVDPNLFSPGSGIDYLNVSNALNGTYDLAVVCTPPDSHLRLVGELLDGGIPKVLCEKPLCGLGQMEEAGVLAERAGDRVSVAYNWRWHPDVLRVKEMMLGGWFNLVSEQERPEIPAWGLLLDHVSHGLDTVRFLGGKRFTVQDEPHLQWVVHQRIKFLDADGVLAGMAERWNVNGTLPFSRFKIVEAVWSVPWGRICRVQGPFGQVDLDTSRKAVDGMHLDMWRDVLAWALVEGRPPPVSIRDAMKTQALIEEANRIERSTYG